MKFSEFFAKTTFFLWLSCFSLLAEEVTHVTTLNDAKVHYTLQIMEHITWKNDNKLDSFVIGLLGKDNGFFDLFYDNKVDITIRGKKLIFVRLNDKTSSPYANDQYSAIVVAKNKLSSLEKIYQNYPHSLIICDGKVNREELMISFVPFTKHNDKQVGLELNRDNLVRKGFQISSKLLDFAGTKSDLSGQIEDNETHMNYLHAQVQAKEDKLIKLNQLLTNNNEKLKLAQLALITTKNEVEKKQLHLTKLYNERKKLLFEITNNQQKLTQQSQFVNKKQKELDLQEYKLMQLKEEIKSNEQALKQQLFKLNEKSKVIVNNEQTISSQRLLLYIAIGVTFILILLKLNILRLSKIRKQANKELTALNEQLYEMATIDSMTKLYNRRHYIESAQLQIAQLQRSKQESALLMIDIDNFKKINDTYGHAMGDEALIAVTKLLRESLREYDIVGRLGGEEFAMFLTHCEKNRATEIAERLREKISHLPISFQKKVIYLTISIGLTVVSSEDSDINHVLQRADKALYYAKAHGRDQVVVYSAKLY